MGQVSPERVSFRALADLKLDGARFQLSTLEGFDVGSATDQAAAQSCADAAIDQMLQGLKAALHEFNMLLPDPLPSRRVSRRNLRDRFFAVECESQVLREIEHAERGEDGWLGDLEEKHAGSAVAPLLTFTVGDGPRILREPLNPDAGVEEKSAPEFLRDRLDRVLALIERIHGMMADDVARYREAQRQQSRRLI